jgi:hypothetical protein
VWQGLFSDLKDRGFMVVAVAEDSRGEQHVRPWIEQARAEYWCLIDPEHRVASLYGMANVPRAVWIDERGRIVRPPETAGSTDHFRNMDPQTLTMSPADQAARDAGKAFYVKAIKQWVVTGRHALDAAAAQQKLPRITDDIARAQAHFRLGVWLRRHGAAEEGKRHLAAATRLHPDSWNMWRQSADLEAVGNAAGPEFWARVQALGDKPYHQPPDLPDFPAGPRDG